jgi:hypothetical protein
MGMLSGLGDLRSYFIRHGNTAGLAEAKAVFVVFGAFCGGLAIAGPIIDRATGGRKLWRLLAVIPALWIGWAIVALLAQASRRSPVE